MRKSVFLAVIVILLGGMACQWVAHAPTEAPSSRTMPLSTAPATMPASHQGEEGALLYPEDLTYVGSFRLPADAPDEIGWAWSGEALAYRPDGDPQGADDGFPGSLFGSGHNWNQYVSEIAIPAPVNSPEKVLEALPVATTLQPFRNIRTPSMPWPLEQPRMGLAYLPPEAGAGGGKLYFSWAMHQDEEGRGPTHGWALPDLDDPQTAGLWRIGDYRNYVTADYLFPIPEAWSEAHAGGKRLATGRYRDGGQGAMGPSLFAIAPWEAGQPPAPGTTLDALPLLLYGSVYDEAAPRMNGYAHSDHWSGGAWLTAGDRAAVVFVGTKGLGETWYGCPDGTVWPDEPPFPPECADRGWWSERFEAQIIFYAPDDLAAVAEGRMAAWEPQPYAVLTIEPYLFSTDFVLFYHLGAAAFDARHGLLYIVEPLVDEDRSIIHVWRVQ